MRRKLSLLPLAVLSFSTLMAQTATRKPGDTIIYDVVVQSHLSGGNLPSRAYAQQPPQNSAIKMAITGIDPSGVALVHVVIDSPFPEKDIASKLTGGPLAAARNHAILAAGRKGWEDQNRYKEFDARFTRDGALLMAVDNSPQSDDSPKAKGLSEADLAHYATPSSPKRTAQHTRPSWPRMRRRQRSPSPMRSLSAAPRRHLLRRGTPGTWSRKQNSRPTT